MGAPVDFPGCNRVLGPPNGADELKVASMKVFGNGVCSVSRWQLTAGEIAEVNRTGCIFVSVFGGQSQPPVFVGGEEETRSVVSDYGVWKR